MGGKSKTTVNQRSLSPEEKALYAEQLKYVQSIAPVVDQLLNKGQQQLNYVYNPDWKGLLDTYSGNINNIMAQQQDLINGKLPEAYTNAKQTYYDNMYKNTMGKGMQAMANSGVINSSRFNTSAKDWQNTMANQMSQDYTKDINTIGNLLNQRESWLQNGLQAHNMAANGSAANAGNYFNMAAGLHSGNTQALNSISNNESSRTYTTTSQKSGIGGFLGGLASVGSMFM